MSSRNNKSANEYGASGADKIIGDVAAEDADHVARHRVVAVNLRRQFLIHAHAAGRDGCDHEQDKQGAHAVVREALPHFGEEEIGQSAGVSGQPASIGDGELFGHGKFWVGHLSNNG